MSETPRVDAMIQRFNEQWAARTYPPREASALAASHADRATLLAAELERKLTAANLALKEVREKVGMYDWLRRQHVEVYSTGLKGARGRRLFDATGLDALDFAIRRSLP